MARLTRTDIIVLVKQLLERAGTEGMTKAQLVAAIGRNKTSLQTVQRALNELREQYEGQIRYSGRDQRWRLEAPLAMPLDAPDRDDVADMLRVEAIIEPLFGKAFAQRILKVAEDMDERRRRSGSALALPTPNAMTAEHTHGSRIEPELLQRLHDACRRTTLRMRYASPWPSPKKDRDWQVIEPWALKVIDGAVFLRAWAHRHKEARTFRVAFIDAVEPLADRKGGAPRQPLPADVWAENPAGYGIDHDRPGVAVIRFRGGLARWIARIVWHPLQKDLWLEPDELLERTIPYRSCRELARRLASLIDGIESIEPRELCEEVFGLFARSKAMARSRKRRARS